jgi:hypothetical protein
MYNVETDNVKYPNIQKHQSVVQADNRQTCNQRTVKSTVKYTVKYTMFSKLYSQKIQSQYSQNIVKI